MHKEKVLRRIAIHCDALKQDNLKNRSWHEDVLDRIDSILPRGEGFNKGSTIRREMSGSKTIIIDTVFHHRGKRNTYIKWTKHHITIVPRLDGWKIKVVGLNYNKVNPHIKEVFEKYFRTTLIKVEL